jgi:hypothetical protein
MYAGNTQNTTAAASRMKIGASGRVGSASSRSNTTAASVLAVNQEIRFSFRTAIVPPIGWTMTENGGR